jgi:nucleotide-binding universal stress UspA family protein
MPMSRDTARKSESGAVPASGRPLTLLVALDLTDKADAALEPAAKLPRASAGRVVLLNVFWPPVEMGHVMAATQEERVEYVRAERRMYLDKQAQALKGLEVSTRVDVQGHSEEVDECIARVAREINADVLVVVSDLVSSAARMALGSVAQGVMRLSPCPVL